MRFRASWANCWSSRVCNVVDLVEEGLQETVSNLLNYLRLDIGEPFLFEIHIFGLYNPIFFGPSKKNGYKSKESPSLELEWNGLGRYQLIDLFSVHT